MTPLLSPVMSRTGLGSPFRGRLKAGLGSGMRGYEGVLPEDVAGDDGAPEVDPSYNASSEQDRLVWHDEEVLDPELFGGRLRLQCPYDPHVRLGREDAEVVAPGGRCG